MDEEKDLIGSVYDVPDWLAKNFPALTGPTRAALNTMRLPVDVGADLLRRGTHAALGLEEAEPMRYSGERVANVVGALGDVAKPIKAGYDAVRSGASGLMDKARQALIAQGAVPTQPESPPVKIGPQLVEFPQGPVGPSTPQPAAGALGERPIDTSRPIIHNPDGSFSTERTITIEADGKHYLIPTIVGGKQMTPQQAVQLWRGGKNPEVGVFGSADEAESAAVARSKRIGQVRGPQGALDPGTDIQDESGTPPQPQAGALGGQAPAAQAPRESLQDAFRKRLEAIEKETGSKLTPEQQKEAQMDFFLRLMASGSRRGSNFLGNVGESGLATSALTRGMREKNMHAASERQRNAREDAFREIGLMDKDEDNRRGDVREAREGRRDDERIKLLREQLEQGKWQVKETPSGLVIIDAKSGKSKAVTGADGKPIRVNTKDTRPLELQLLDHVKKHPEDLEPLLKIRGKDKDDSDQLFSAAIDLVKNDLTGKMTADDAVRRAGDVMRQVRGGPAPAVQPPAGAVAKLKQNPSLAKAFDEKYGAGAAKRVLGQ